ncbi:MAG: hypothetical protein HMLKMBBP_03357 [Planctomycetes bacterium]|nr:hypothetical protein [Planctomycetota bacterium]
MTDQKGIWVRITLDNGARMTGFATGADSPNDFWIVFKTQLVKLAEARVEWPGKKPKDYPVLYVNRDRICLVDAVEGPDGED